MRDCLAVLDALDAAPAHVIGVSYSAAVALELAGQGPAAVRSLTIVEPPPRHVPAAPEFLAANQRLLDLYQREGATVALEAFMTMLVGSGWRPRQEALAPGSVARIERDADAFFSRDIPALVSWTYGPDQAARVTVPVLYAGGTESGPWFRQTEAWVSALFPAAQRVTIEGAGHDLAFTHPPRTGRRGSPVPRRPDIESQPERPRINVRLTGIAPRAAESDIRWGQPKNPCTTSITTPAPRELLLSTVAVVLEAGSWTDRAATPAS